jgi:hypothetical protein
MAYKMQLFFIENQTTSVETSESVFKRRLDNHDGRRPGVGTCDRINAGNHNSRSCSQGRSHLSSLLQDDEGGGFNNESGTYIGYDSLSTGALMYETECETEKVAFCSASYYAAKNWPNATKVCSKFNENKCDINGYITNDGIKEVCCDDNNTTNVCNDSNQFSFVDIDLVPILG